MCEVLIFFSFSVTKRVVLFIGLKYVLKPARSRFSTIDFVSCFKLAIIDKRIDIKTDDIFSDQLLISINNRFNLLD